MKRVVLKCVRIFFAIILVFNLESAQNVSTKNEKSLKLKSLARSRRFLSKVSWHSGNIAHI